MSLAGEVSAYRRAAGDEQHYWRSRTGWDGRLELSGLEPAQWEFSATDLADRSSGLEARAAVAFPGEGVATRRFELKPKP